MACHWFSSVCVVFFNVMKKCARKKSTIFLPSSPLLLFLQSVLVIQWMACRGAGETITDSRLFRC